jgi:hypothetical protein
VTGGDNQESNLFGRGRKKLLTIFQLKASKVRDHGQYPDLVSGLQSSDFSQAFVKQERAQPKLLLSVAANWANGDGPTYHANQMFNARIPKLNMNTSFNCRIIAVMALLCAGAIASSAQSGRRSKGETTTPTAPSVSGTKTVEKKPEKAPRIQLLVGVDNRDPMANIPYYVPDTVIDNCVRRLGDAADVGVTSAGRGMNRAEAIRRAKEETVRYVVLLQIGSELADAGRKPSSNSVDELYVSYIIFEPGTAKQKQSGRSHHQIYQTGRGGVSTPTKNSPLYSEYALKQAARETAERILAAFEIKLRD